MFRYVKYFLVIVTLLLLGFSYAYFFSPNNNFLTGPSNQVISLQNGRDILAVTNKVITNSDQPFIADPIADARSRVTKKTFGLKVSPQNSPVSPERFSGYHTGVDFETTAEEKDTIVPINTICNGPLILKKWVSGYGGVVVQSCQINKLDITVVYGHLKLDSVQAALNQELLVGSTLGQLGQGYSSETDQERKHLHLGIHRGKNIDLRGYVGSADDLTQWIDALTLVQ
ncbi:MAG: hypothetical protein C3F02_03120 [Parcubacteria group bacterium]|nr:MAG: hypothetical protein C3F02_03120 [Parcubacteria group bacterium]